MTHQTGKLKCLTCSIRFTTAFMRAEHQNICGTYETPDGHEVGEGSKKMLTRASKAAFKSAQKKRPGKSLDDGGKKNPNSVGKIGGSAPKIRLPRLTMQQLQDALLQLLQKNDSKEKSSKYLNPFSHGFAELGLARGKKQTGKDEVLIQVKTNQEEEEAIDLDEESENELSEEEHESCEEEWFDENKDGKYYSIFNAHIVLFSSELSNFLSLFIPEKKSKANEDAPDAPVETGEDKSNDERSEDEIDEDPTEGDQLLLSIKEAMEKLNEAVNNLIMFVSKRR